MATKKITELTALTTADAADVLAIVDMSGNTTNKITANNLAVTTNYLKFLSGDYSSLAIETKNDAACDTGFTMTADTLTEAGTHNRLTLTATATNNQTNIGAELSFFCRTDGTWQVAFLSSELGSGALNTNFATSAV